ncbi:LysR family transcriptional regulator [Burkholderia ambifaria]|uniref:LysR family transcriptional regulator n=1 Tax=Burkholderia ambifaria TaxID=152480 RepID=UPI00158C5FE8|nr:LysR family transcriptional regulator [Burkholderia ambifaria]
MDIIGPNIGSSGCVTVLSNIGGTHNWTLAELRAFCLVCECRNLTQVALRLEMSQSAVSLMVQRWRVALGTTLFVRTRYGVTPTDAAMALRDKLHPLLEGMSLALANSRGFDPKTSERVFRLHMSDIGQLVFLPGLNSFLAQHAPGIRLQIKNLAWEALEAGLSAGEVDVAIGSLPMIKGRVSSRVLRKERYVTAMRRRHPLAKRALDLAAFASAEHMAIDATSSGHSLVESVMRSKGMQRRISLTMPHFLAAERILGSSDYLLTVPEVAVMSFRDPSALHIVPTPLELPTFDIRLHWHERSRQDQEIKWLRASITSLFEKT